MRTSFSSFTKTLCRHTEIQTSVLKLCHSFLWFPLNCANIVFFSTAFLEDDFEIMMGNNDFQWKMNLVPECAILKIWIFTWYVLDTNFPWNLWIFCNKVHETQGLPDLTESWYVKPTATFLEMKKIYIIFKNEEKKRFFNLENSLRFSNNCLVFKNFSCDDVEGGSHRHLPR